MFNELSSSPVLTNCIFSGNSADYGGGLYCENSRPTITDCNFTGNKAIFGGGLYNDSSSPTVTNCRFSSNTAIALGGGMYNYDYSEPNVTNCTFTGNTAENDGGGMCNSSSSPTVTNCIFYGNKAQGTAYNAGGGMYNYDNSDPTLTNCTFYDNSAEIGGGIYNYDSQTVTNCILWANATGQIDGNSGTVNYSNVQGGYSGTGNINADPCFVDAASGNLRLVSSLSPCVDAGNNNAPDLPAADLQGSPRVLDGNMDGNSVVDMGALELDSLVQNNTRNLWYLRIQDAIDDANSGDEIKAKPGVYHENVNFFGKNIVLTSMDPNDHYVVGQTVIDAQYAGSVVTFDGNEDANCVLAGFTLTHGSHRFGATHGGAGIYCFQSSPTIRNCIICGNVTSCMPGAAIDCNAASPSFSGCTVSNNSATGVPSGSVVFENGSDVVLEDCTITNNFSNKAGGILCRDSNPRIIGCIISYNEITAEMAGGIYCEDTNAVIDGCIIAHNSSPTASYAGGIECSAGYPTIRNSIIADNDSQYTGGGVSGCAGPIENCAITRNTTRLSGGGLYHCTGPIANCIISDNQAYDGGGLSGCGPIVNCLIINNSSQRSGAGLRSCSDIVNCTIVANRTLRLDYTEGGGLSYCTGITNCIIWDNYATTSENQLYSCSDPNYSCIQDWAGGGTGNITDDPCFVYPGYWADANDPNVVVEPNDPNAIWMGDSYRLSFVSACIDAGDNNSVPADTTDLDGDGNTVEPIPYDFDNRPRFADGDCNDTAIVDMGAYEFDWLYLGDFAGGCDVDFADFAVFALAWHSDDTPTGNWNPDCDISLPPDGIIDEWDLKIFTDNWLVGTE